MSLNNKDMGDRHEEFLASLFQGKQSKGSGNQWRNPMDGRTSRKHLRFAFAWDGKSTLRDSIGVTRRMWAKAREQAGGERPMLGLRWYEDGSLRKATDLVAVTAFDMAEVLEAANKMAAIEDQGCLIGAHAFADPEDRSTCVVCGACTYDLVHP